MQGTVHRYLYFSPDWPYPLKTGSGARLTKVPTRPDNAPILIFLTFGTRIFSKRFTLNKIRKNFYFVRAVICKKVFICFFFSSGYGIWEHAAFIWVSEKGMTAIFENGKETFIYTLLVTVKLVRYELKIIYNNNEKIQDTIKQ